MPKLIIDQEIEFYEELAKTVEMVNRDFPNAEEVIRSLNELRTFVHQAFKNAYSYPLRDTLITMMTFEARIRVLLDHSKREIGDTSHRDIKADKWRQTFADIVAQILYAVGLQRLPKA